MRWFTVVSIELKPDDNTVYVKLRSENGKEIVVEAAHRSEFQLGETYCMKFELVAT